MGTDGNKILGNLFDPFRIVSSATKALTGSSGEQWLGVGQKSKIAQMIAPGVKMSQDAKSASAIPAPTGQATEAEKARIRKKKPTILTSPLTGGEDFGGSAPTLLGTGATTKKATLG